MSEDCPATPGECQVIQPLRERMTALELAHRNTSAQVADMTITVDRHSQMLDTLQSSIDENSTLTRQTLFAAQDIKDIVTTGRVMSRFARWLAPTLLATAAALAVVKGWASDVAGLFRR